MGFSFLTRSKYGVWYYQRWIPSHIQTDKRLFRVSLGTKDKKAAERRSRVLSVKFDELITDIFKSPKEFSESMRLLYLSAKAGQEAGSDFRAYEELFLSRIGEWEEFSFEKAERFKWKIQDEFEKLADEIAFLREVVKGGAGVSTDAGELAKQVHQLSNPELPPKKNPDIDAAFQLFVDSKPREQRQTGLFVQFVKEFGVRRLSDLDEDLINRFIDFYRGFPKSVQLDGQSIKELMTLKGEAQSAGTLIKAFNQVSVLLNWWKTKYPKAVDDDILVSIRAHGVKEDTPKAQCAKKERPPYTDEELKILFNPETYGKRLLREHKRSATSARYWIPLLMLYSGARLSELGLLERHNIYEDGGVWVFEIKYFDSKSKIPYKRAKEKSSERVIPIHPQLIKLGFIDYVEEIKTGRIFPDEEYQIREKYGKTSIKFDAFSKWFSRRVKKLGIEKGEDETKALHNFRHLIETKLIELKYNKKGKLVHDHWIIDSIVGHSSSERSVGQKHYNHAKEISAKNTAIERIQYPFIDFEGIIRWDHAEFYRKKFR